MSRRIARAALAAQPAEVDSLRRGLEILRCFRAGDKSLLLADIVERTKIPRLTAQKLLNTLTAQRFMRHLPELDRYEPDVSCFVVGHALRASLPIIRVARPLMLELAAKFDIDVYLALREDMDMMIIEYCTLREEPGEFRVGTMVPLSRTAAGRAWLWAQRPAVQGEFIERIRSEADERELSAIAGIYRAFQDLAERGYCFSLGEWMQNWQSIATPLILAGGRDVFALAAMAAGPGSKETSFRETIAPALVDAAMRIKSEMSRTERA